MVREDLVATLALVAVARTESLMVDRNLMAVPLGQGDLVAILVREDVLAREVQEVTLVLVPLVPLVVLGERARLVATVLEDQGDTDHLDRIRLVENQVLVIMVAALGLVVT